MAGQKLENVLDRRQQLELIAAIEGSGYFPFKFMYLGEQGVRNWITVANERMKEKGAINYVEGQLFRSKIPELLNSFGKVKGLNLIDIGCGDGIPVLPILNELKKRRIPFTYAPMDISREMADTAIRNVTKEVGKCVTHPIIADYERGNFSDIAFDLEENGYTNLLLFLGSTIGNPADIGRALSNFKESMTSRNFMIVGAQQSNLNRIDKLLLHYKTDAVANFVTYLLPSIGIKRRDVGVTASWNDALCRIEMHLVMKRDVEAKIMGSKIFIEQGEKLLVVHSKKFTAATFTDLFLKIGFRTELLTTDANNSYILSMVQPSRHTA